MSKKEKNEPIRIAQIIGKWVGGGVEAFIMNYYRHIDRTKIQFDFICDEDSTCIPYEEIEKLGGKVIIIPPYQKAFKYHKELKKVLKEEKYKIVHSHINTMSLFSLFAAKMAGVPIRIAHSHSTTNKKETIKNAMKTILKIFSKIFATHYFACSEIAGKYQFGEKTLKDGKIEIINNAIDTKSFRYDENLRSKKRKELGIKKDELIIGHIGRYVTVKNHAFVIETFSWIHKKIPNAKLLLIGQGPLEEEMKNKAKELKLEEKVLFLGQRKDANELYQAMDCFVFPSLYEGLGMVAIEAQCSGLSCLCSTAVPEMVKLTELVEFIELENGCKKWADRIVEMICKNTRKDHSEIIKEYGYDINDAIKKLEEKYIELNKLV